MTRSVRTVTPRGRSSLFRNAALLSAVLILMLGAGWGLSNVQASPSAQRGGTETFNGTVVAGTVSLVNNATQFSLERQKLIGPGQYDPNTLEQVICRLDGAALSQSGDIQPGNMLQVTGNYDPQQRIFFVTSLNVLVRMSQATASQQSDADNGNDNRDSGDNGDNGDNGSNDNSNNSDNGSNDNGNSGDNGDNGDNS